MCHSESSSYYTNNFPFLWLMKKNYESKMKGAGKLMIASFFWIYTSIVSRLHCIFCKTCYQICQFNFLFRYNKRWNFKKCCKKFRQKFQFWIKLAVDLVSYLKGAPQPGFSNSKNQQVLDFDVGNSENNNKCFWNILFSVFVNDSRNEILTPRLFTCWIL